MKTSMAVEKDTQPLHRMVDAALLGNRDALEATTEKVGVERLQSFYHALSIVMEAIEDQLARDNVSTAPLDSSLDW